MQPTQNYPEGLFIDDSKKQTFTNGDLHLDLDLLKLTDGLKKTYTNSGRMESSWMAWWEFNVVSTSSQPLKSTSVQPLIKFLSTSCQPRVNLLSVEYDVSADISEEGETRSESMSWGSDLDPQTSPNGASYLKVAATFHSRRWFAYNWQKTWRGEYCKSYAYVSLE